MENMKMIVLTGENFATAVHSIKESIEKGEDVFCKGENTRIEYKNNGSNDNIYMNVLVRTGEVIAPLINLINNCEKNVNIEVKIKEETIFLKKREDRIYIVAPLKDTYYFFRNAIAQGVSFQDENLRFTINNTTHSRNYISKEDLEMLNNASFSEGVEIFRKILAMKSKIDPSWDTLTKISAVRKLINKNFSFDRGGILQERIRTKARKQEYKRRKRIEKKSRKKLKMLSKR